jgi:hypothetical protein
MKIITTGGRRMELKPGFNVDFLEVKRGRWVFNV